MVRTSPETVQFFDWLVLILSFEFFKGDVTVVKKRGTSFRVKATIINGNLPARMVLSE